MYMAKLKGVLLEEDYIRYSKKFIFERTNFIKKGRITAKINSNRGKK